MTGYDSPNSIIRSSPATIFTNMYSRVVSVDPTTAWPVSFELPPLQDASNIRSTSSQRLGFATAEPSGGRKRKQVTKCPHTDRSHYAKGMCNNCYHRHGREKRATKCPHSDKPLYAKGKCQQCYLHKYHSAGRRRTKRRVKSACANTSK